MHLSYLCRWTRWRTRPYVPEGSGVRRRWSSAWNGVRVWASSMGARQAAAEREMAGSAGDPSSGYEGMRRHAVEIRRDVLRTKTRAGFARRPAAPELPFCVRVACHRPCARGARRRRRRTFAVRQVRCTRTAFSSAVRFFGPARKCGSDGRSGAFSVASGSRCRLRQGSRRRVRHFRSGARGGRGGERAPARAPRCSPGCSRLAPTTT